MSARGRGDKGFEKDFAAALGVTPVKGSGSFWYAKMDIKDSAVLWSLKHTDQKSFGFTPGLMHEVVAAIKEYGHIGMIPGVAVRVGGEVYTVLRAQDQLAALTQVAPYIPPSKAEARRQGASLPALLRD